MVAFCRLAKISEQNMNIFRSLSSELRARNGLRNALDTAKHSSFPRTNLFARILPAVTLSNADFPRTMLIERKKQKQNYSQLNSTHIIKDIAWFSASRSLTKKNCQRRKTEQIPKDAARNKIVSTQDFFTSRSTLHTLPRKIPWHAKNNIYSNP